jgi:type II secretory pathway component PulF
MKLDEFAFMNQQLAAMLRDGIPLEGALRQLSTDMRQGALKSELEKLEAALAKGAPLKEALVGTELPEFYKRMLLVGAQSNDVPGMLTLLADYYQRQYSIWTRLKGLMVYPLIVLFAAFMLSCAVSYLWGRVFVPSLTGIFGNLLEGQSLPAMTRFALQSGAGLWGPPLLIGLLLALALGAVILRRFREAMRWRVPTFKDAALAQAASAMWVMLKGGVNLGDAMALLEKVETGTRAALDLKRWQQRLAAGMGKFSAMAAESVAFPPLFVWLVANGGEDLAAGFKRAAEVYQARAQYRTEAMLYAALPVAVLMLGVMILTQAYLALSVTLPLIQLMNGVSG